MWGWGEKRQQTTREAFGVGLERGDGDLNQGGEISWRWV